MKKVVIIPTYNECENVARMTDKVMSLSGDFDLLFVDDGSPDGTADIIREKITEYGSRVNLVERSGKLGLGTAYIAGFKWALERNYDQIFEMDCDFSHNPDDLLRLASRLESGADVVVGSRYVKGMNVVNWPLSRILISYGASLYVRTVTRMPIYDSTAGFVGYRAEVLRRMNLDGVKMIGYGFQIEMKYTAWQLGFKVVEESIVFTDRELGTSKMSSSIFGEAFFGVMKLPFRKLK
ncbi:MAG: polyprenol monophosphomannose synthase [Alistipes sp.]|nr:polyprenol monophosphomannose synthase [Alistipes sp.]